MEDLLNKMHETLTVIFTAPGRVYVIAAPVLIFEIELANLLTR